MSDPLTLSDFLHALAALGAILSTVFGLFLAIGIGGVAATQKTPKRDSIIVRGFFMAVVWHVVAAVLWVSL